MPGICNFPFLQKQDRRTQKGRRKNVVVEYSLEFPGIPRLQEVRKDNHSDFIFQEKTMCSYLPLLPSNALLPGAWSGRGCSSIQLRPDTGHAGPPARGKSVNGCGRAVSPHWDATELKTSQVTFTSGVFKVEGMRRVGSAPFCTAVPSFKMEHLNLEMQNH